MPLSRILDSHIHLWPSTSTQPTNHGWMTPNHQLAKQHGIVDYKAVIDSSLIGFVYVETDRYLPSPAPPIGHTDQEDAQLQKLEDWAKEPLEELKFLRRIVEDTAHPGDGFQDGDGHLLRGAVIYAPFHLPPPLFSAYLHLAEHVAGPQLWHRVVGFRYLLQGKPDGEVQRLVQSDDWLANIASLGRGRGGNSWTFDVGVDTHRDGVEQLEAIMTMIQEVRRREDQSDGEGRKSVKFVLNHLAKPLLPSSPTEFDTSPTSTHTRWRTALSACATDPNIFMKLSGAFNEFEDHTPDTVPGILSSVTPFFDHVFHAFEGKVMFGSDWPVCNVGGPRGEAGNWGLWRDVVERYMAEEGFGEGADEGADGKREDVWWRCARDAYAIEGL